jgi:putative ABC transport system permease protein
MDMFYNKQGNRLTFAWPIGQVMADLFDKLDWFDRVLGLVCYLVAVVAAASILASIYNSINERRREIAILRALGARRLTVVASILLEAASISALGVLAGFVVYAVIVLAVAEVIRAQTGIVLDPLKFEPVLLWAPVALVVLGVVAGIAPALKAYRTQVAEHLVALS